MAVVGVSIFLTNCGGDNKSNTPISETPIKVKVNQVQVNDNAPFLAVSGTIQAVNSAELSTRMMGFVKNVHVNVGDKVRKGQLLVSINNTDLQAKSAQVNAGIAEATAAYNNAKKDYERYKNLFADNSASRKELDDMTANYNMAEARLESANQMKREIQSQFAYSNILAPFQGVITGKSVKEGDMANPGVTLLSLENPSSFEVVTRVPETEISKVISGMDVKVLVKSINETISGKVSEVSRSAKNTGGQYIVKIALNTKEPKILSGMFTTVRFPLEKQSQAESVMIPTAALITKGQLTGVYTISKSNTALLRWLRLGREFNGQVEVLSGLSVNESYIISAEGKLYNGANVSVQ